MPKLTEILKKYVLLVQNNFYFKNIFLALGGLITLFVISLLFLRLYTNHGQALSVPDIRGMTLEEAQELLEKRKLKYEVADSVYITDEDGGVIIEQVPRPEYKVKKHRTIFVTINAYAPEMVTMPNLVGFSVRQARAVLETRGLNIGRLIYVPDVATNYVLQQKIKGRVVNEGDSIVKGAMVDLEIGNGLSNRMTPVPNLIKLKLKDAKMILNENFLNLGAPIYDNTVNTVDDTLNAIIFRQKPEHLASSGLPMGSFVDVWLTIDSTKMPGYDSIVDGLRNIENNVYDFDPYD